MKSGSKLIFNVLLSAVLFLSASAVSFASDNSVSSVSVKENARGEYNILLKTDKSTKIKKSSDKNTLILTVNSAVPSDNAEIIYDNAPDVKNVTVQKKDFDGTVIMIQGDNIENAEIYSKDLSSGKITSIGGNNAFFSIPDKKFLTYSLFAMLLFFAFIFNLRSGKKEYFAADMVSEFENINDTSSMTLRHKNEIRYRKYVPSINAGSNGAFNAMTTPGDFDYAEEDMTERIRKAG